MNVAKFSACFCHQSIDHPVCKSLVGTYDGRYFKCRKEQSSPTIESQARTIKRPTSVLPFVKVTLTRSSSTPKNPSLLHWLIHCHMFLQNLPGEREG